MPTMARTDRYWRLLVVTLLVACQGFLFDHNGSVPAPPRARPKPLILDQPSTIIVPVSVSLSDLSRFLEAKVPKRLVDIQHERLDKCIPAKYTIFCAVPRIGRRGCAVAETKTKISPDIDCELNGHVDRGPIRLEGSANHIVLIVPVSGEITARGRGELGKIVSATATGGGDASASIGTDISSDWHPQVSVDPQFKWTKPPGAWILGFWITFADRVQPELDKAMLQLKQQLREQVAKLNVPALAAKNWQRAFVPLRLSHNPNLWLRFEPRDVGLAPLEYSSERIDARVMVSGTTQIFVGQQPTATPPSPLPPLTRSLAAPAFHINLPLFIDYGAAEAALKSAFKVGETQTFAIPHIGDVRVAFRDVTVYATQGDRLAIGITLSADPTRDFLETSGTIWLTGKLRIDTRTKRISVSPSAPFEFSGHTDNTATNLLLSIVRIPAVRNRIESSLLNLDISDRYDQALAQVTAALNGPVAPGLLLQTSIDSVSVSNDVAASSDGIYVGLELTGKVGLRTSPL